MYKDREKYLHSRTSRKRRKEEGGGGESCVSPREKRKGKK
jgi:hypothetical protein